MDVYVVVVGTIETNCYLAASEKKNCAVIDPGANGEKILGEIEEYGLTPQYIVLTHGHYDHTGAVKAVKEKFHQAKVCISGEDEEMFHDFKKCMAPPSYAKSGNYDGLAADVLLKDGDTIALDELTFQVIATPGHTKGGISLVCGDALFTGDTLFCGTVGRTDLYGGSYEAIVDSVNRLAALPGDYSVFPGHSKLTTLEEERQTNPYIGK